MPYIKLTTLVKQWFFDILLKYESPWISITTFLLTLQSKQNIIQRIANRNPITTITKLSRLNDPHIFLLFSFLLLLLELAVVIVEHFVLWVLGSFGDVESQGQALEDVQAFEGVVLTHVIEQSFLIANVIVLLKMVMKQQLTAVIYLGYVLANQHVQPLQVGSLIDQYLVFSVSRCMLDPYLEVTRVEDVGMSQSIILLSHRRNFISLKRVNMLFFSFRSLLMLFKDRVYLQLSPDKIASFSFIDYIPPKSPFYDAFYHQRIISSSNICLINHFFRLGPNEQPIRIIYFPQKIDIIEYFLLSLFMNSPLLIQPANKRILFLKQKSIHDIFLRIYLPTNLKAICGYIETINPLFSFIPDEFLLPQLELHRRFLLQYLLQFLLSLRLGLGKLEYLFIELLPLKFFLLPHGYELDLDLLDGAILILHPPQPQLLLELALEIALLLLLRLLRVCLEYLHLLRGEGKMIIHMFYILTSNGQEIILLLQLLVDPVIDLSDIVLISSLLRMVHLLSGHSAPLHPLLLPAHKCLCIPSRFIHNLIIFPQGRLFGQ